MEHFRDYRENYKYFVGLNDYVLQKSFAEKMFH